jgi:hypothetical protein
MTTSNTYDCFREFVGQRLIGLLFDALPSNRHDLRRGNRHLIFEDGRALTLSNNGTYWIDSAEDVRAAVARKKGELSTTEGEIRDVLALAEGTEVSGR